MIMDDMFQRATEALADDQPRKAAGLFRSALSLSADPGRRHQAVIGLDEALLLSGEVEEADSLWQFELLLANSNIETQEGLLESAFRAGRYSLLLDRLDSVEEKFRPERAWQFRYEALIGLFEAEKAYAHIEQHSGEMPKAFSQRARNNVMVLEQRFQEILDQVPVDFQGRSVDLLHFRAQSLVGTGQHDLLERELEFSKEYFLEADWIDFELARNASTARWASLAAERWGAIFANKASQPAILRSYIEALWRNGEIDRAADVLDQQEPVASKALIGELRAQIVAVDGDLDGAIASLKDVLTDLDVTASNRTLAGLWGNMAGLELQQYERTADRRSLETHLNSAKKAVSLDPDRYRLRVKLADALIRAGYHEEARRHIDKLPAINRAETLRLRTWKSDTNGEHDSARSFWNLRKRIHHIPQIHNGSFANLTRVDENLPPPTDGLTLYTVIKDEIRRLPWFFDYYRRLGVENFVVVDNGSTDGSADFLLNQNGVTLFTTNDSYFGAFAGMVWVNHLKSMFSPLGWSLYVDVDEALVFDGCDQKGLPDLIELLEQDGDEAFTAFMLDMFNLEASNPKASGQPINYVTEYTHYISDIHRDPKPVCPYVGVRGGVRSAFGTGEELTKTPLIKSASGIDFLQSSHNISPARLSPYSGVMLHYKMVENLAEEAQAVLSAQKRSPHCRARYRKYLEFETLTDLLGPALDKVQRYEHYRDLITQGLMPEIGAFSTHVSR